MSEHISNELSAFLDGRLPEAAARETAGHLATCSLCQREADDLRALKTGLAALPRPRGSPTSLMRSLNHAFLDAPRPRERRWNPFPFSFAWKPVGAFAAAAAWPPAFSRCTSATRTMSWTFSRSWPPTCATRRIAWFRTRTPRIAICRRSS